MSYLKDDFDQFMVDETLDEDVQMNAGGEDRQQALKIKKDTKKYLIKWMIALSVFVIVLAVVVGVTLFKISNKLNQAQRQEEFVDTAIRKSSGADDKVLLSFQKGLKNEPNKFVYNLTGSNSINLEHLKGYFEKRSENLESFTVEIWQKNSLFKGKEINAGAIYDQLAQGDKGYNDEYTIKIIQKYKGQKQQQFFEAKLEFDTKDILIVYEENTSRVFNKNEIPGGNLVKYLETKGELTSVEKVAQYSELFSDAERTQAIGSTFRQTDTIVYCSNLDTLGEENGYKIYFYRDPAAQTRFDNPKDNPDLKNNYFYVQKGQNITLQIKERLDDLVNLQAGFSKEENWYLLSSNGSEHSIVFDFNDFARPQHTPHTGRERTTIVHKGEENTEKTYELSYLILVPHVRLDSVQALYFDGDNFIESSSVNVLRDDKDIPYVNFKLFGNKTVDGETIPRFHNSLTRKKDATIVYKYDGVTQQISSKTDSRPFQGDGTPTPEVLQYFPGAVAGNYVLLNVEYKTCVTVEFYVPDQVFNGLDTSTEVVYVRTDSKIDQVVKDWQKIPEFKNKDVNFAKANIRSFSLIDGTNIQSSQVPAGKTAEELGATAGATLKLFAKSNKYTVKVIANYTQAGEITQATFNAFTVTQGAILKPNGLSGEFPDKEENDKKIYADIIQKNFKSNDSDFRVEEIKSLNDLEKLIITFNYEAKKGRVKVVIKDLTKNNIEIQDNTKNIFNFGLKSLSRLTLAELEANVKPDEIIKDGNKHLKRSATTKPDWYVDNLLSKKYNFDTSIDLANIQNNNPQTLNSSADADFELTLYCAYETYFKNFTVKFRLSNPINNLFDNGATYLADSVILSAKTDSKFLPSTDGRILKDSNVKRIHDKLVSKTDATYAGGAEFELANPQFLLLANESGEITADTPRGRGPRLTGDDAEDTKVLVIEYKRKEVTVSFKRDGVGNVKLGTLYLFSGGTLDNISSEKGEPCSSYTSDRLFSEILERPDKIEYESLTKIYTVKSDETLKANIAGKFFNANKYITTDTVFTAVYEDAKFNVDVYLVPTNPDTNMPYSTTTSLETLKGIKGVKEFILKLRVSGMYTQKYGFKALKQGSAPNAMKQILESSSYLMPDGSKVDFRGFDYKYVSPYNNLGNDLKYYEISADELTENKVLYVPIYRKELTISYLDFNRNPLDGGNGHEEKIKYGTYYRLYDGPKPSSSDYGFDGWEVPGKLAFKDLTKDYLLSIPNDDGSLTIKFSPIKGYKKGTYNIYVVLTEPENNTFKDITPDNVKQEATKLENKGIIFPVRQQVSLRIGSKVTISTTDKASYLSELKIPNRFVSEDVDKTKSQPKFSNYEISIETNNEEVSVILYYKRVKINLDFFTSEKLTLGVIDLYFGRYTYEELKPLIEDFVTGIASPYTYNQLGGYTAERFGEVTATQFAGTHPKDLHWLTGVPADKLKFIGKDGAPVQDINKCLVQDYSKFYLSVNKATEFDVKFMKNTTTSDTLKVLKVKEGEFVNPTANPFIDNPYDGEYKLDLDGKVFLGWFLDKNFTQLFEPNSKIYTALTLYPKIKDNAEVASVLNMDGQALKGFKEGADLSILGANVGLLYIPNRINSQSITSYSSHKSLTEFTDKIVESSIKHIRLPKSVNRFYAGSFANLQLLSRITNFPGDLTELNDNLFYNCKSLTTLHMTNNITKIGKSTFEGCASIANITFSTEITSIGQNAFKGASRIGSVDLSRLTKLTSMSLGVFSNSGLTYIHIPDQLTSIPEHFAEGAMKLSRVKLGKNTKIIGAWAFYNCKSLIAVELGNAEMVAKKSAFKNTSSLKYHSVALNSQGQLADTNPANYFKIENFITILNGAFLTSGLVRIKLNPNVKGQDWNYNDGAITPNMVSQLAFMHNFNVTEIEIPEGIRIIGGGAFGDNKQTIQKVVLPSTLQKYTSPGRLNVWELDCSKIVNATNYYFSYFFSVNNPNATKDNPAKYILNPERLNFTYDTVLLSKNVLPVCPDSGMETKSWDFGNRTNEYIGNGSEIYRFTSFYTGKKLRSTYNTINGNAWSSYGSYTHSIDDVADLTGITSLGTPGIKSLIATGYNISSVTNICGSLFGGNVRFNNKNVQLMLPSFIKFDKEVGVFYGEVNGQKRIIGLVNGDIYDNLDFSTTDPQSGHTFVDVYSKGVIYVPYFFETIRNSLTINKEMTVQDEGGYFCILHRPKVNNFAYYSTMNDFNTSVGHAMQELTVNNSFVFPSFKTFRHRDRTSLFGGLTYNGNNDLDFSSITRFDGHFFGSYGGIIFLKNATFKLSNSVEYISGSFDLIQIGDDFEINTSKKLELLNNSFHDIHYNKNKHRTKANTFALRSQVGIEYNSYISEYFHLQQLVLDGKFTGSSNVSAFPFDGPRLTQIISRNNVGSNFKKFRDGSLVDLNNLIVINDTTQTFDWTTVGVKSENIYTGQLVEHNNLKYVIANNEAYLYGYNQKQLTPNVDVPEQVNGKPVTKVLNGAFMNVVNLEKINFPTSIKSFGTKVFADSRKLKSVNFDTSVNPDALKAIDDKFFGGAMETLNIPKGVKTFSVNSILNTKNRLQSIKGPNTEALRIYNNSVISNDNNYIVLGSSSTIIGWGIKGIDAKAFQYSPINKLDFRKHPGRDLEVIGAQAFKNSELTSVVFKVIVNGVEQYLNLKEIGDEAFMDAAFLKTDITIEIPASVTYIGARAFASTNSLGELMNQNSVHIRLMGGETQAAGFHPDWKVSLSPSQIIFG